MAFLSLQSKNPFELFPSLFTKGKAAISINGLIWMGSENAMIKQIKTKIKAGFRCIKIKIGAIDFEKEIRILKFIRQQYKNEKISIRLDANGAFSTTDVLEKLYRLAKFDIHSIEQPIAPKQWKAMKELCKKSPIPIALDEELIENPNKKELLEKICPQYIILKPSLLGGFKATKEWIKMAEKHKIKWWITSALESNIGLNAITQWTFSFSPSIPQGLGTGNLYTNNFQSPLFVKKNTINYTPDIKWNFNLFVDK